MRSCWKDTTMLKRISLAAGLAMMAAACASEGTAPAAPAGPGPVTPTAPSGVTNALNIAATSQWEAEERLMPQDPILALIMSGGSVEQPAGFYMTCNPANGSITARLGMQPSARVGQTAVYRIRMGAEAKVVEGKFETNTKNPNADFVFPLTSADLRGMAGMDMVSVVTDAGDVQWAFVKDPAAPVQARYVASLKNLAQQSRDYLVYCNPK
jgi:hypothetical protein